MPGPLDHALAIVLIALFPPRAWFSFRALKRAEPGRRAVVRRRLYLGAMITQWGLCAALIGSWALSHRTWAALGLSPVVTPGAIGMAVGLAIMASLVLRGARNSGPGSPALERARERLAHVEPLLPHSITEFRLFGAVAVTAGVCEELLFRGFLIGYFANYTGLIQAALLSSVCFGIGHAYQGLRYILVTALVGAFFAGAYLVTGSLVLPMLIHALMDLYSGWMGYRVCTSGAIAPEASPLPAS
jgi:membrane protease YdiL (CAAX protease family)